MNYPEKLNTLKPSERIDYFLELCNHPEKVQETILTDILQRNSECEFGRKYKFADSKAIADYRQNVPITHWDDYDASSVKMQNGEKNILFSGDIEYFIITSGTTGKEKILPESYQGKLVKDLTSSLRNNMLIAKYPSLLKGKFLPLSNSSIVGHTPCGIPFGTASGMTTENTSGELAKLNACPQIVKQIPDQQSADYAIMRFAMQHDVRIITGNNAGRIPALLQTAEDNFERICTDIEKGTLDIDLKHYPEIPEEKILELLTPLPDRAEELRANFRNTGKVTLHVYWPNLEVIRCWLAGSVGGYIDMVKPYLNPNTVFMDAGYGASEGKFNIPMQPGNPSGPLSLFSGFYEFIPVEDESIKPEMLCAHELETGKDYRLILTTYSGLYRYDMKDIIRVDGFTGKTPNIRFVAKTADVGNICGEKMSAEILRKACKHIAGKMEMQITHICAIPDKEKQCYIVCIESNSKLNTAKFADELDNYLQQISRPYETFRGQNLIGSVEALQMRDGWQGTLYKEKLKPGVSISQIKLPFMYREIPGRQFII